jgi:hypothetical protein
MKAWMLLAHDPATGAATEPVAFVAHDGTVAYFEAVPARSTVEWDDRWHELTGHVSLDATTVDADTLANFLDVGGIGLGVVDLTDTPDLPSAIDVGGMVAQLMDSYLMSLT